MRFISLQLIFLFVLSLFSNGCGQPQTEGPSLEEKIGQMLVVGFRGSSITVDSPIANDIASYHLGGVVLFDYDVPLDTAYRNIISPRQVEKLTEDLQQVTETPLIISIDQEGGKVVRLKPRHGFPPTVSAQYLGKIDNADTTQKYARQTAELLKKLGINTNLAPVVDLNMNPDNPVIGNLERSFSADPQIVTRQAKIYIQSLHEENIISALKHYPGHGSSEKDSHLGVVDVTGTWQEKELIPYRNLISAGLADIIMTAHIYNANLDPEYPATLSKSTIQGLLRDSLGFDGVVMSDDLQMQAIRSQYPLKETIKLSIQAGVDMLVFANNSIFDPEIIRKAQSIIKELIEEGAISRERIDESYDRIMALKEKYLMSKE